MDEDWIYLYAYSFKRKSKEKLTPFHFSKHIKYYYRILTKLSIRIKNYCPHNRRQSDSAIVGIYEYFIKKMQKKLSKQSKINNSIMSIFCRFQLVDILNRYVESSICCDRAMSYALKLSLFTRNL